MLELVPQAFVVRAQKQKRLLQQQQVLSWSWTPSWAGAKAVGRSVSQSAPSTTGGEPAPVGGRCPHHGSISRDAEWIWRLFRRQPCPAGSSGLVTPRCEGPARPPEASIAVRELRRWPLPRLQRGCFGTASYTLKCRLRHAAQWHSQIPLRDHCANQCMRRRVTFKTPLTNKPLFICRGKLH